MDDGAGGFGSRLRACRRSYPARLAAARHATSQIITSCAGLTGTTPDQAARTLDALARASLIHTAGQERYTMNRLLQAYALEQAIQHQEHENRAIPEIPIQLPARLSHRRAHLP